MRIIIKTDELCFEVEKDYESDISPTILKELITKVAEESLSLRNNIIKI